MMKHIVQAFRRRNRSREEQKLANLEQDALQYVTRIFKHDSRKERRQKLKHSFERNNVVMTVQRGDILKEVNDEDEEGMDDDDADLYEGCLILPRTGVDQTTSVPNCCIICLDEYKPGDVVVWSSNTECQHAFHRSCVVKYFVKIQKKIAGTPCPCCRSDFTDLQVERRQRKNNNRRRVSSSRGATFHLSNLLRMFRS